MEDSSRRSTAVEDSSLQYSEVNHSTVHLLLGSRLNDVYQSPDFAAHTFRLLLIRTDAQMNHRQFGVADGISCGCVDVNAGSAHNRGDPREYSAAVRCENKQLCHNASRAHSVSEFRPTFKSYREICCCSFRMHDVMQRVGKES